MKIRISGNSLRLRLSQSELEQFRERGVVEEAIHFADNRLIYRLVRADCPQLYAGYSGNEICIQVPEQEAQQWTTTDQVGIEAVTVTGEDSQLKVLVEKDFKCLHQQRPEDHDNFSHPQLRP